MITNITGLPGNGKTLFALWWIKQKAEKEQREVYYNNIKDLTLPWTPFEAEKWMDLPHGSIIVMDECQFVFPKKPNGSKLPDYYEQLATHRHKGFDIYLITQHPTLMDNFVRQLVGQHYHVVRKFGLQRATVYEWSACNPAPQNPSSQKSAVPMKWSYPKEVYGYYKSAEVHTVKRAIPMKLFLAAGLVVGVLAGGYWALDRYQHRGQRAKVETASKSAPALDGTVASGAGPARAGAESKFDPMEDAKEFAWKNTPRVVGLPQTAPKYDELTKPTSVPVPAMCIEFRGQCQCKSQQNTPLAVKESMCREFARNGFFQEFDPDRDRRDSERTARSVAILNGKGGEKATDQRESESGPRVAVMSLPAPESPHVPLSGQAAPVPQRNVNGGVNLAAPPVSGSM